MQRLNKIDPATATGPAKDLLDNVKQAMGMVPNIASTMAQSPALLEGYLTPTARYPKALCLGVCESKSLSP